ncbi:family 43 glycosylhydrolase [uncultured Sunxiuqinia sp.]|uniref:family 43 glycosylhydrolase n=1 Tax=uncultured Sunxiuqinia sp. TaxID=1573825 RepID=UPI002632A37D|nr:family 43 glycosylhydrolase [uncultured Sunxiuqinia sp.]
MRKIVTIVIVGLALLYSFSSAGQSIKSIKEKFSNTEFTFEEVTGIGYEAGVTRRDPSDVIKVDRYYYVYYTKIPDAEPKYWGAGYWGASVWCARSEDGYKWEEVGEVLGLGEKDEFDSQATFTPNILHANGRYYLYYTGVKPTPGNEKGEFENNSTTDITAIGVAVSDSPEGPFTRVSEEPILKVSVEPEKFDSYRVDDAVLLYRNGLFWLYYKGRARAHDTAGPAHTQTGVAFSKYPVGPFTKMDEPILPLSHEVMLWQQGTGVAMIASLSNTFEYAPDGIDFMSNKLGVKVENRPLAPGVFRQDLTDPKVRGEGLKWGISMVHNKHECYLTRFELISR